MILCPAAGADDGALLFGSIDQHGQVAYHATTTRVTQRLLLELPINSEQQFRFASPCVQGACHFWSDGCSLSSGLSHFQAFPQHETDPGSCAIQDQCRWHIQDGPAMCQVCQIHSRRPGAA